MKEINNPPPKPEDPERSLDPDSQEDPDLCVELIDGVFHQLSKDNTLVAITADSPFFFGDTPLEDSGCPLLVKLSLVDFVGFRSLHYAACLVLVLGKFLPS